MRTFKQFNFHATAALLAFISAMLHAEANDPSWSGRGKYRILVEVPAIDLADRARDASVASAVVDFPVLLRQQGWSGQFDPSSLHMHQYDPDTGTAIRFEDGSFAADPHDIPCRFDDELSPQSDLSRVGSASDSDNGLVRSSITPRKARLFNREPASTRGKIVWVHSQSADVNSTYAIYFDLIDSATSIPVGPAPWIGDIDVLRYAEGQSLGAFAHFTLTTGDLNGDGLFDLVAGTEKGDVMWFPNRGTSGQPRFVGCELPEDQYGPIDCGWYAAPFVYDWNSDGLPDLLMGTRTNVIVWWRNIGTPTQPKWEHVGFVRADDKPLAVPQAPVAEDDHGIFKVDYYNQPWIGDFNADGFTDIITGGYTTGRIFLFAGTGRDTDGVPVLAAPTPVEADGQPIDTVWAAAPFVHDFDHDGLPDLVTGTWFWTGIHRPKLAGEGDFLAYFLNIGTRNQPQFARRSFPKVGEFPHGEIARPTAVDFNADGLVDLLVNDGGGNIYPFLNVGAPQSPKWNVEAVPLTIPWGFTKALDVSVVTANLDKDATPEFMAGDQVMTLRGGVYAPVGERRGVANVRGVPIDHPGPGYGDGYYYTWLADWNGDGQADLLWGTQQGNIYLHLKSEGNDPTSFEEGELLTLSTGEPLRVGPPVVQSPADAKDFTVLQGSRILIATEDFDRDGLPDLMVSETYGNLWFFRREEIDGHLTLAPGIVLAKLPRRTESLVFDDWDHDDRPDLLLGGPPDHPIQILFNRSVQGQPALEPPQSLPGLPYVFWGAKPRVTDWNRDGDADIMIQSEFFSFFAERSFLEHGYRSAALVSNTDADAIIQIRRDE
ncbi:MAG: VCBS repeat-containing protein [Planctomycetaceae bacterium]|nr:VCBS repeat-containing protein [Planctomycetaceae bacterium]